MHSLLSPSFADIREGTVNIQAIVIPLGAGIVAGSIRRN
jgi:hypothetical protein